MTMYNEKENLERGVLDEMMSYLKKQKYSWEVVINDDGSDDNSLELVEKFIKKNEEFKLLKSPHAGKPAGLRTGMKAAKGEIILFTDVDQSTPLKQVEKLLPFFEKDYDVVIGSRGVERKNFPWYRQLMSWGFRVGRQLFLLKGVSDTQCGFKAFRAEVIKKLFPQLQVFKKSEKATGWRVGAFDVELLFLAQKHGHKIAEVPVAWQDRDVSSTKEHKFAKESKEMLKEIIRVKINDLKGMYD